MAYALRGSRGTDINRRNALSLAEHALTIGAHRTIVTEAADTAGPLDQVTPEERAAALLRISRRLESLIDQLHALRARAGDTASAWAAEDVHALAATALLPGDGGRMLPLPIADYRRDFASRGASVVVAHTFPDGLSKTAGAGVFSCVVCSKVARTLQGVLRRDCSRAVASEAR